MPSRRAWDWRPRPAKTCRRTRSSRCSATTSCRCLPTGSRTRRARSTPCSVAAPTNASTLGPNWSSGARRTADLALGARDIPRIVAPDLNDIDAGRFEGGDLASMRVWLRQAGPAAPPPGGRESRVGSVRRYVRALRWLLDRPERTILVVAHGLFVTYVMRSARGDGLPLTLEGTQAGHAEPHRLRREEAERAAARLD